MPHQFAVVGLASAARRAGAQADVAAELLRAVEAVDVVDLADDDCCEDRPKKDATKKMPGI